MIIAETKERAAAFAELFLLCGHAGAGELLVQPAKFQWREPGALFKDGDEMAGV